MDYYGPIWKDVYDTFDSSYSPLLYQIFKDGEINAIFVGKAYAAPSSTTINININKICQNHLDIDLPDLRTITATTAYTHPNAFGKFNTSSNNNYYFLYDWSYTDAYTGQTALTMSHPINGHYAVGQLSFDTQFKVVQGQYGIAVQECVKTTITPVTASTYCGQFALYYLNRYGGFDSFLIEGKYKRSETYDRYYINKAYNNTTLNYDKKVYNNQITTSYELNTGWLTDSESENLAFNLMPSNMIYLHDLVNGTIQPVIIKDESVEYKTFGYDKKMASYRINVECSQTKTNL